MNSTRGLPAVCLTGRQAPRPLFLHACGSACADPLGQKILFLFIIIVLDG